MTNETTPFFARSKQVAERFLQTAVIIDDRAYFDDGLGRTPISTTNETIEDVPRIRNSRGATPDLTPPKSDSTDETASSHLLDAQAVINSFAKKQIVCSVIKPAVRDDFSDMLYQLAQSADALILDWDLNGDNGEGALDVIEHAAKASISDPAQLRLFVIYTGEPDISYIVERVESMLRDSLEIYPEKEGNYPTLKFGSCRVAILAKPGVELPESLPSSTKATYGELAERVVVEFTMMTAGLVSNVALEALTVLRSNSFRILGRFSKELDAPYLTHRMLQPLPEDAEDFLVSLIAAELHAIVDEMRIGTQAGISAIEEWLTANEFEEIEPFDGKKLKREHLLQLALSGKNKLSTDVINKTKRNELHKSLTKCLSRNRENLDEQFASLTNFRTFYKTSSRVLTLGTIVRIDESGEDGNRTDRYLLCLLPVCDSVRLPSNEPRAFPFIPLKIIEGDNEFSIVVYEGIDEVGSYKRLNPDVKPYNLRLISFKPLNDRNDRILSEQEHGPHYFTDVNGTRYWFTAQLRSEHSLRNLQRFTNTMSRIGLNESEWLRLSAPKD